MYVFMTLTRSKSTQNPQLNPVTTTQQSNSTQPRIDSYRNETTTLGKAKGSKIYAGSARGTCTEKVENRGASHATHRRTSCQSKRHDQNPERAVVGNNGVGSNFIPRHPSSNTWTSAILQFCTSYELVEWLACRLQEVSKRMAQEHRDQIMI